MFAADEVEILSYFEVTYVGKKSGPHGDRRAAMFPPPLWDVHDRMDHGRTRTNNGVESFHSMYSNFLLQAAHPSVPKFMDSLHVQQRTSNLDMGNIARGESNKEKNEQVQRNKRLITLAQRYLQDRDGLKLRWGVAYNYM